MRKKLNESLKRAFRPEFINRVDSTIIFRALNKEDIKKIVRLELDKVATRLVEHSIILTATPEALTCSPSRVTMPKWARARCAASSRCGSRTNSPTRCWPEPLWMATASRWMWMPIAKLC
jgi:hypothetical protein